MFYPILATKFDNAETMLEKTTARRLRFKDDIIACLQNEINESADKGIEYTKVRLNTVLKFESGSYYIKHYRTDFIKMIAQIFDYFNKKNYEIELINSNAILDNKPFDSLREYNTLQFIISWHKKK